MDKYILVRTVVFWDMMQSAEHIRVNDLMEYVLSVFSVDDWISPLPWRRRQKVHPKCYLCVMLHTVSIAKDSHLHTIYSKHLISQTDLSNISRTHYLRFQDRLVKFERLIRLHEL